MEVAFVAVAVAVATAVLFTPYLAAQTAGQDAWVSVIIAGLLTLLPSLAAAALMRKFPGQTIIGALPRLVGKVPGKAVGLAYAALFLFSAALAVWRLEVFTARFLLTETPLIVIRAMFLVCAGYAAISGTIALIRTSAYIVPAGMVVIFLVVGLPLQRMDVSLLIPLFENGYRPALEAGLMLTGWLSQIPLVILMLQRHVSADSARKPWSIALWAVLLSTVALELGAAGTLAAFGPRQAASMYYSSFELTRIISLGNFWEHIEVIFVAVWIAGIFVAAAFYIQAFNTAVAEVLQLSGKAGKVIICGVTLLLLLIWPFFFKDLSFLILIVVIRKYGSQLATVMGGILPPLLLVLSALIPGGKGKTEAEGARAAGAAGQEDGKKAR